MGTRQEQLLELRSYIGRAEKELTLALQTLQWDHRRLLEDSARSQSPRKTPSHASILKAEGYRETDIILPDANHGYGTVVKLDPTEISEIIRAAAENNSEFKTGTVDAALRPTPQSYDRLVATFTSDERRAIYDAVVSRAPPTYSLEDLTLPGNEGKEKTKPKSYLEIQSELRDMKRRRTKYKVATKSKNYSQVLREVIRNQMELYTGIKEEPEEFIYHNSIREHTLTHSLREIKQERVTPESEDPNSTNKAMPPHSEYVNRGVKEEPSSPPRESYRQQKTRSVYRQDQFHDSRRSKSRDRRRNDQSRDHHRREKSRDYHRRESRDSHRQEKSRTHYSTAEFPSNEKHHKSKKCDGHSRDRERHSQYYRASPPRLHRASSYDSNKRIKIEDDSSRENLRDHYNKEREPKERCRKDFDEDRHHKHRRHDATSTTDKTYVNQECEYDTSRREKRKSRAHHRTSYREERNDKK